MTTRPTRPEPHRSAPAGRPASDARPASATRPASAARPAAPTPTARRARRRAPLLRTVYGGLLRGLRLRQGRTLAEVAADAGISVAYLSEVERGLKEPSSEVLDAVCWALGSSITSLIGAAHRELVGLTAEPGMAPVLDLTTRIEHPRSGDAAPSSSPTAAPSASAGGARSFVLAA
jgi:transcriptional regulator with XRE-family HTH domain